MTYSNLLSLAFLLACITNGLHAYPFPFETMTPDAGICLTGKKQSPIDVQTSKVEADPDLSLTLDFFGRSYEANITYQDNFGFMPNLIPINMNMRHDTYQVLGPYGMAFADNANHDYLASDFKQLHFHSPAVNTIDGQLYDAEAHFMFLTDLAQVAGLNLQRRVNQFAVLFNVDDSAPENPLIAALNLDNIGATLNLDFNRLVVDQIGANPEFYYYEGSLDNAGCDEIIDYYIVKQHLTITTSQLDLIVNVLKGKNTGFPAQGNNRALQPLNGRVVKLGNVGKGAGSSQSPSQQKSSESPSQQNSSHSGN